ncbi:MAG: Serine/threonine-protein kinase PknD [Phycisphaerae bacterium]|nr:Serine/threonine-protein kinase PknD [Phycisphaerae bacterium]
MNACPNLEALEALAAEPDDASPGWAHVRTCPACRDAVARIRRNNADLAELATLLTPTSGAARVTPAPLPMIEGYKLLAELRAGGQGVVYKALQERTSRVVALKVLHGGAFASPQHRARFEREIDLVARLRHPNIITLFDSGSTPQGRLYYAMEYLHGAPLDAWTSLMTDVGRPDAHDVMRRKLELFCKVCAAVNYAHQRGVIHRDLKPGNILVDGAGEPHVLDFGLAKAPAARPGEEGPLTETGGFLGTLHYAAPEQFRGDPDLVDIRADVYSLGVILYEMLTGRRPFSERGSVKDIIDAITGGDPDPPSLPAAPGAGPAPNLDEDLDTIVMTAIARERERRYHSAEALRLDVAHYLAGEPIEARRASAWYILRKTAGRYRAALIATGAGLLALAGFSAVVWTLYARADDQRRRADRNANRSQRVVAFLDDLFRSADAFRGEGDPLGAEVSLREVLSLGAAQLREELGDDPLIRARLLETLGTTLLHLDELDQADPLLRQALALAERSDEATAADRARLLSLQGRLAYERADYAAAERHQREALALLDRDPSSDPGERASVRFHLAVALEGLGRMSEAEALHRGVLESRESLYGRSHRDVAESLNALGLIAYASGRLDDALTFVQEAYDIRRTTLNPVHPDLQESLNNLAVLLELSGRTADARRMYETALDQARRTLGARHQYVATILVNLADLLDGAGETARAEDSYLEAIRIWRETRGADNPLFLFNYAEFLRRHSRFEEARQRHADGLALRERALTPDHLDVARSRVCLASTLRELGRLDEAQTEVERARRRLVEPDAGMLEPLADLLLGRILLDRDEPEQAEALLNNAVRRLEAHEAEAALLGEAVLTQAHGLARLRRWTEARDAYRRAAGLLSEGYGGDHSRTREALDGLKETATRAAEAESTSDGRPGAKPQ